MNDRNILEYKGYHTRVECSLEDGVLFGKIEGIRDLVTFECDSIPEAEAEFHKAVDDYLEFCAEVGKEPEKEYKGQFNVRIAPELHRRLAIEAFKADVSMNTYVEEAIKEKVEGKNKTELHFHIERPKLAGYDFAGTMVNTSKMRAVSYGAKC